MDTTIQKKFPCGSRSPRGELTEVDHGGLLRAKAATLDSRDLAAWLEDRTLEQYAMAELRLRRDRLFRQLDEDERPREPGEEP